MPIELKDLAKRPYLFKFFLLKKMPLAFFAGLKLEHIQSDICVTSLPYRWTTQNPFESIYFAAQSMAAEFSTGALIVYCLDKLGRKFGMLVVGMKAEYFKKATSRVTFTCSQGPILVDGILDAIQTKQAIVVKVKTEGRDEKGELISIFHFTWSLKDLTAEVVAKAKAKR